MKKVKLIDLPIDWKRGNGFTKSDIAIDGNHKCVLYGELFTKHKNVLIDSYKLSRTNQIGSVKSKLGDILVPGTSTAVKRDMILARELDEEGVFLGGDINIIRPRKDLFAKKFVAYYFETIEAYDQLEGYINGSTGIIHISNTGLKNLEIPILPLSEQKSIVSILDDAFESIERAKSNAKQNLKNAKELFESYLQGVFENKGEDWEVKSLKEITTHLGDGLHGTPKYTIEGEYYFINGNNLSDGIIELKSSTKRVSYEEYVKYKKNLTDRTILVSINGTLGNVAFYNKEKIILGKSACYFNIKDEVDKHYIKFILSSPLFLKYAHKEATGATIKNVSLKSMREFPIPIPDIKTQIQIVIKLENILKDTNRLESIYQQKLNDLEELKKSILQKAFNGELKTSKKSS
jgi:type I restriction enzyme S subunit